jgi:hypothetical protein
MTRLTLGGICWIATLTAQIAAAQPLDEPFVCPEDGTRQVLSGNGVDVPTAVNDAIENAEACVASGFCSGFGVVSCLGPLQQDNTIVCRVCATLTAPDNCQPRSPELGGELERRESCDPILLDFGRIGIELTSAPGGVAFDLDADGEAEQVAWTERGSEDAFLVLDRNGNGTIDDGGELFGNATRLADGTVAPNGYVALEELGQPESGGNANGFIDRADRVYRELRLWTDTNHDGFSDPTELTSLEARGVIAIRTSARRSRVVDEHGNRFALVSVAYLKAPFGLRPILTTDVFLVEAYAEDSE